MLKPALEYREEIKILESKAFFEERNKFYFASGYKATLDIPEHNWDSMQFVSLKDDKVIGFMHLCIDRTLYSVSSLRVINYYQPNPTFSTDFAQVLIDIFEKYNFNKLVWNCVIGNPAEKMYDRICKKYNGRVVGIFENEVKLLDGKLYHQKYYEILLENYKESKNKK